MQWRTCLWQEHSDDDDDDDEDDDDVGDGDVDDVLYFYEVSSLCYVILMQVNSVYLLVFCNSEWNFIIAEKGIGNL